MPGDGRLTEADAAHMRSALALAERGLGEVWPNPSVGCVLVTPDPTIPGGRVLARARTARGGRPHAETQALAQAGAAARGATAYVSLEPCDHQGQTGPCTEALIGAGVASVVVACGDPDPRVSGAGLARLRQAGVKVEEGLLAAAAEALNEGFIRRVRDGRPMVTVKVATTLDGRTATRTGESQWITGDTARAWGHGLRARHDAIAVGINTVLSDDPDLTCRLPGLAHRSPVRVVVDGRLRLPPTARLVKTAATVPTWLAHASPEDPPGALAALRHAGVDPIALPPGGDGGVDLDQLLRSLAARGITRLLVEGGARLVGAFLRAGLVDRIEWFRASSILGGDGFAGIAALGIDSLGRIPRFRRVEVRRAGEDLVESYCRT